MNIDDRTRIRIELDIEYDDWMNDDDIISSLIEQIQGMDIPGAGPCGAGNVGRVLSIEVCANAQKYPRSVAAPLGE